MARARTIAAKIQETRPRMATLHELTARGKHGAFCERHKNGGSQDMFRLCLTSGEQLVCWYDDMTVQSAGIEFELHVGIKRTDKIALYDHAAEPFLPPDFHFGPKFFTPIEGDGILRSALVRAPGDRHPPAGYRQRAEFCCVYGKLMQREAQVLRRFRLERDGRPFDRYLRLAAAEIA